MVLLSTVKNIARRILKRDKRSCEFTGNYNSWQEAEQASVGYDAPAILNKIKSAVLSVKNGEAVYERDSVLFDEVQYSKPLLEAFNKIVNDNNGMLSVIDFGGSLGTSYFANRNSINNISELKWGIVEQPHFVDCGKEFIADEHLKFFYSIDEALSYSEPQTLLLSGVMQYIEHPYDLIKSFLKYNFKYILVDRTFFIEDDKERIIVQQVPPAIYRASYAANLFNEKKFLDAFLSEGYTLISQFNSVFDSSEKLEDGKWLHVKGFFLEKK